MRSDRDIDKALQFRMRAGLKACAMSAVVVAQGFSPARIGERVFEAVAQDVRYGVRSLRQSPMFSLATIAVVALGIAASTAMFALVDAWLLRPLPLERTGRTGQRMAHGGAVNPREPAYFVLYSMPGIHRTALS